MNMINHQIKTYLKFKSQTINLIYVKVVYHAHKNRPKRQYMSHSTTFYAL